MRRKRLRRRASRVLVLHRVRLHVRGVLHSWKWLRGLVLQRRRRGQVLCRRLHGGAQLLVRLLLQVVWWLQLLQRLRHVG